MACRKCPKETTGLSSATPPTTSTTQLQPTRTILMLTLLDKGTVPPGGFRYLCQETKSWIQAASFAELVHASEKHRAANHLGISDNFREEVEAQLCSHMPAGTCKHEAGVALSGTRRLTFQEVVTATKTLGSWFLKGTPKVTQDEAEKRANICLSCPMNQNFDGCTTCAEKDLREAIVDFMGHSKTPYDSSLFTCFTCGCTLKAAIWFPLEILKKHMTEEVNALLPAHCWKK